MIHAPQLLADLTRQLKRLEDDLRARIAELPELDAALRAEWQAARDADRCAEPFESWADQVITQAGVHWLLSCVFLRFIEDNQLVDRPWLSGTPDSGRLALARDRHEAYFRAHPLESDRDYLLAAFREAGTLHGLQTFFDEAHNPVFRLGISGDAAMALRQFWQAVDPASGALVHDFTDPEWDTRFLGDLYQDLSEATRKRYALLQTPEFVEEFILDRTLTPAIREFGYQTVRLIDPTCGSGHFLLGGFRRLVAEWQRREPGRNPRDIAQKALDAVAGVDLNPFAVAIARFRLLVAALKVCEVRWLADAPNLRLQVAIGDSLLHGPRFGFKETEDMFQRADDYADTGLAHAFASEDLAEVQKILGRQYHAVVGNPPYIVVKDAALNQAYRRRYVSCHRQYSLGCPFTERFFELAQTGRDGQGAGFVGLITANSFMKREFGSKLIEQVLPALDLTHVIDTSGAYIPGHGTPTVILFGRHRPPVAGEVRTVMGIKGEPSTPEDPAKGQVWSAIVGQVDVAGSESDFVSVTDTRRTTFGKHPWSIGGGGASDLKEALESGVGETLGDRADAMGFFQDTHADDVFVQPTAFFLRGNGRESTRACIRGDGVRDWSATYGESIFFPYDEKIEQWRNVPDVPSLRWLWSFRTTLWSRSVFGGQTYRDVGRPWFDYHQFPRDRARASFLIAFGEIATHNHFVLDRGGKVFNRTAPVIKLPTEATEDEHLGLLGLLNSSVACFWFQQVCHNKGGPGGGSSKDEKWHDFYAFNSTKVAEFPLVDARPVGWARRLDALAQALSEASPASLLSKTDEEGAQLTRAILDEARARSASIKAQMVAAQEELDWHCYRLYGLLVGTLETASPPEVRCGERAFEIVMARRLQSGALQTRWFEWLGIEPVTTMPSHWPSDYRALVQKRIELIESDRNIGLVESPNCKRRWEGVSWDDQEKAALRDWLLARLESVRYWPRGEGREDAAGAAGGAGEPAQLSSINHLADAARLDADFMQIAELYAGRADFDVTRLVDELVAAESVPFLPVLRYTETGLRKRAQWEDCWALQRREDAGEDVAKIPVPPKYQSKDFQKADFWRLRGGLDVPKERWVSYPGCERGADGSLPIAWAGWDHLQQATALAAYYLDMKDTEGWPADRLLPLLAGLLELLPWLKQWHNQLDPNFGERMGDYYDGFVRDEAKALGVTLEALKGWKPALTAARRGRRRSVGG